jgi:hypothetical protein
MVQTDWKVWNVSALGTVEAVGGAPRNVSLTVRGDCDSAQRDAEVHTVEGGYEVVCNSLEVVFNSTELHDGARVCTLTLAEAVAAAFRWIVEGKTPGGT